MVRKRETKRSPYQANEAEPAGGGGTGAKDSLNCGHAGTTMRTMQPLLMYAGFCEFSYGQSHEALCQSRLILHKWVEALGTGRCLRNCGRGPCRCITLGIPVVPWHAVLSLAHGNIRRTKEKSVHNFVCHTRLESTILNPS